VLYDFLNTTEKKRQKKWETNPRPNVGKATSSKHKKFSYMYV
jgi:hypothetical protein